MDLSIEPEKESEYPLIYELVKSAFETAQNAEGDEHDYVNQLRKTDNYIPELSFTVKDKTRIIGHIMLTRMSIDRGNIKLEALLLSPVCVQLEYRNMGIGSKLIEFALSKAKGMGFKAVFLVGDSPLYAKLGFISIVNFRIKTSNPIPEEYALAMELEKGYLGVKGGMVSIC